MADDELDKILRSNLNRPVGHSKILRKLEKGVENPDHPAGILPKCRYFKDDYEQCADGLSWSRAKKECKPELEDLLECYSSKKLLARHAIILKQRKKLMKEGKYTPPPFPPSLPSFADSAI